MSAPRDIFAYRDYIENALAYAGGSHTFKDVCDAVAEGRMQFWPGEHAVVITEIIAYPQHRTLNFFLAGGSSGSALAELEAMEPGILEWGRAQGCTQAVFTGRKGWERTFLVRSGWEPKLVVFEKPI